jgi:membrane protease subunit HflK
LFFILKTLYTLGMANNDDFGKGGSPWGSSPGGEGNGSGRKGPTPPNIDEIVNKIQDLVKKFIPGNGSGKKPIILGLVIVIAIWAFSGLYRVLPDEQGVVLRFGKFVSTTQPGLNYHIPYPVETVLTPKVTKVNRIDVGFRAASDTGRTSGIADVSEESLMLTGDENIVNIDFSVFWVIKDAGKFLFKIQSPVVTVKAAAETAMREVIARSRIQPILTEGRSKIEIETQEIIQSLLDEYESGIQITQVQTQKADPPDEVIDAFRDVQAARADMERSKNEAEAYQNDVIPRARGDAAKILQEAEAYKKQVVALAEGEASRFLAIYNEYKLAKKVTQERMYLETMEKVLADIDKVIIDKKAGGVVPYLPLPELTKKSKGTDTQ